MTDEDKVADFQSLTGVPPAVARNMLEAANWDIEVLGPLSSSARPHGRVGGLRGRGR